MEDNHVKKSALLASIDVIQISKSKIILQLKTRPTHQPHLPLALAILRTRFFEGT